MKEYLNKIICDDCLNVMGKFPDKCIDLTVTSPPYDNLRTYNGYTFDFEGIAQELYRVTKDGGVVVWVVGDATIKGSETGTSFKQALYFKEIGFNLHDTMIYRKSSPYPASKNGNRYTSNFEYMFIFSKGKPKSSHLIADRKNRWGGTSSFGTQTDRNKNGELIKRKKVVIDEYGVRFNIWEYATGYGNNKDGITNHPAIFPEQLAKDHIISWSNEGDTVLDPMCGSGTTLKMAKLSNRNYIGIEISPEYVDIANKRIKDLPERLI